MNASAPASAAATGARRTFAGAAIAAGAILGAAAVIAVFARRDPRAFYQAAQEDGPIEWATFWAFCFACIAFGTAARQAHGLRRVWLALLAAFALFVALEEISWAQRIFRYRAPVYFLEHNFQEELNLHNVASQSMRERLWIVLLGGWGVAVPLGFLVAPLARLLDRLEIVAPPLGLAPVCAALLALQLYYPMLFTGELVELMFGVTLLFVALVQTPATPALGRWFASIAMIVVAAWGSAAWSARRPADPAATAAARGEVEALAADFSELARVRAATRCNLHKRVYTLVVEYGLAELEHMHFASLSRWGAPAERLAYFLDPWNSPYWVRDQCAGGRRRTLFVYSLGPNQRRESSAWRLGGDDIGVYVLRSRRLARRAER